MINGGAQVCRGEGNTVTLKWLIPVDSKKRIQRPLLSLKDAELEDFDRGDPSDLSFIYDSCFKI